MSQQRWQVTPLTLGAIIGLSGLVGAGLSAGLWAGELGRAVQEHERRINVQDQRIESIEKALFDIRLTLAQINNKIDRL